ncbi:MAG: hypothetical protein ACI915_005175, partial [Gammaproteobacteria bacterium]
NSLSAWITFIDCPICNVVAPAQVHFTIPTIELLGVKNSDY